MLLAFAVALAAASLLARCVPVVRAAGLRVAEWLERPRWAPLGIVVATAIILTLAWGSWREIPVVHDEASYLFQAKLFASGHWTAPSPPLPEFFEQWHVFVVPHYASKYPPGHALLMVPGIWLGLPGMMPVLLSAAAAGLVFSIARRLTNGTIALWTWVFWLMTPVVLWGLGSYFSQSTSIFVWMLGWYALLRWRDDGASERWLLLVAGCVAWLAFTRPLTAVAYALPVGGYVLWRVARTKQYATLGRAMALGSVMLLVIPVWSAKTIGTVRETPYALYSRMYFPWDAPGFGLDSSPPMRALPPDMALVAQRARASHSAYVPRALPRAFAERASNIAKSLWRPPRVAVFILTVIGVTAMTSEIAFGLASLLSLLVAYLSFNHDPNWVIYYLEPGPVLALLAALGLWRTLHAVARLASHGRISSAPLPLVTGASLVLVLLAANVARLIVDGVRSRSIALQSYQRDFLATVETIPAAKAIVFVRYGADHEPHHSLLFNEPDLANAKRWLVYDRGADDAQLMRAAPDRAAYLYDDARHLLRPISGVP